MKSIRTYLVNRSGSFGNAFRGILYLILTQSNARIHMTATVVVLLAGWILEVSKTDWLFLLLAVSTVWLSEGFNTTMEYLVDLVSPEFREKAGKAKDISAGAVLIAAIFAFITGLVIFVPDIIQLL